MRHDVPSRCVLWGGYALGALVLAWLLTGQPLLGLACALVGGLYSLISLVAPGWMPRVEIEGLPRAPDSVVRWSHRILGAAGIPLWVAAWRGQVPQVPTGLLVPVGVGIAVAVAAEFLAAREQDTGL